MTETTEAPAASPIGQTGKRFSPENPSAAMKSFAEFIRAKGYDDSNDLVTTVAATFVFHREWQAGHAGELAQERADAKAAREAAQAEKAQEREAKKAEREAAKLEKEKEKEEKKAQRDAAAAEKAAKAEQDGETGDAGTDAPTGEPRKRLKLKKDDSEELADASTGTF